MNATVWTTVITNLMLISGGAVVLVKAIEALRQHFEKKKNSALQEQIKQMQDDLAGVKKAISEDQNMLKKAYDELKEWVKKLEDDLDYLMKLLLDKSLKK